MLGIARWKRSCSRQVSFRKRVCGGHAFWRNDRLKPIFHHLPGVILLGAMRPTGTRVLNGRARWIGAGWKLRHAVSVKRWRGACSQRPSRPPPGWPATASSPSGTRAAPISPPARGQWISSGHPTWSLVRHFSWFDTIVLVPPFSVMARTWAEGERPSMRLKQREN